MKDFNRKNQLFSLCGLNCALCRMKLDGYCPGCGGGNGNQGCSIARCSIKHGNCEYCFECSDYPCNKYSGISKYDSFITHRNQLTDMQKAMNMGTERYNRQLKEKSEILRFLLSNYNDSRRKTFFCIAVNLLSAEDVRFVLDEINSQCSEEQPLKDRSSYAVKCFGNIAKQRNIILKLHKKP